MLLNDSLINKKNQGYEPQSKLRVILSIKLDGLVKSRHPGENRGPDGLQLHEKTGFRLGRHPGPRSGTE